MILIFGRRPYGRVDACGSEYAHTTFAHLYYLPVIPLESFWVTQDVGGQRTGFSIPMHGKSVVAAYLRCWAPIVALAVFASAPVVAAVPLALALLGASGWAWTWRATRGELAVRRSDFHRLAFGVRCDPARMSKEVRDRAAAALRDRWARSGATRSPDDVARFGAADSGEAVAAYGLLRIAAVEHRSRAEHAAAERILRGAHDPMTAEDGPYRASVATAPAEVHSAVAAAAATVDARSAGAAQAAHVARRRAAAPVVRARRMGIAALVVGAVCAGGLIEDGRALRSVATGTVDQVLVARDAGDYAQLTCDHVELLGELTTGGRASHRVYACASGERMMAILAPTDGEPVAREVTGKLTRPDAADASWYADVGAMPGAAPLYLTAESPCTARVGAILCLVFAAGALGLGGLAIRGLRRAKRAA